MINRYISLLEELGLCKAVRIYKHRVPTAHP